MYKAFDWLNILANLYFFEGCIKNFFMNVHCIIIYRCYFHNIFILIKTAFKFHSDKTINATAYTVYMKNLQNCAPH